MSGSHGDLFREIGKLVLAAHAGQSIDLSATSEALAERYDNLGMPPDLIAKAIARSLGAISISMAIVSDGGRAANARANGHNGHGHANGRMSGANGHSNGASDTGEASEDPAAELLDSQAKAASALFPSGLRVAVLS